ncbi:hypothetical protein AB834_04655 [PVC group bacterium (ex Bugula neritina AB1)]|nr:hypothetical protein AB834_04655 [PVC group bacterium (ex Bugula neritina AB1)]
MLNANIKPEILAPAGNLSKFKVALEYGADAVYVGAPKYGLRQGADNLSCEELQHAVSYAHDMGKRVYVAMNAMPHEREMPDLSNLLKKLEAISPDALIISDAGLFSMAKKETSIPIHVSTQASVSNAFHAKMWALNGAKRVVLAREVSLQEARDMREYANIELESFVHGSMCVSYSGKCTISSYTAGRDSNRGGCVHSCRYSYRVEDSRTGEFYGEGHIMNARDLMGVRLMPDILKSGLSCLKIEGRMKSPLYVAQVTRIYRQALDACWKMYKEGTLDAWNPESYEKKLSLISNRTFSLGNLQKRAFRSSVRYDEGGYQRGLQYVGIVRSFNPKKGLLLEVRYPFSSKDDLTFLLPDGNNENVSETFLSDINDEEILMAKPNSLIYLKYTKPLPENTVFFIDSHSQKKAG